MSPEEIEAVVRGEVCGAFAIRGHRGALEEDDLWQVARIAAWEATSAAPVGQAGVRVRVRRAVRDALRAEFRAQGRTRGQILWPVYWPRTHRDHYRYTRPLVLRRYCRDCG